MSFYDYDYETVAEKIARAKRQLAKLKKKNPDITPVQIDGNSIAHFWWGNAWVRNLATYADYTNRISRGKSYVKNGFVLDLKIDEGMVEALVCGSGNTPYRVTVEIKPLPKEKHARLLTLCNHQISRLEELLEGRFPKELAELFTQSREGLFPMKNEISFQCSCPDSARMCKHVSAVLFAIGARFDEDPTLFFKLRAIAFQAFLSESVEEKIDSLLKNAGTKSKRTMEDGEAAALFGEL